MFHITTKEQFSAEFMGAIGYALQFGRIPTALYPRMRDNEHISLIYPYARIQKVLDMANPKNSKKRTSFGNVEFINFKFDKETKVRLDEWLNTKGNTVFGAIFETLQADNKLSVSYDPDNECFIGAMTGKDGSLNKDKCITIRSAEWLRTLGALAFIHVVLFDGEIWQVSGETDLV